MLLGLAFDRGRNSERGYRRSSFWLRDAGLRLWSEAKRSSGTCAAPNVDICSIRPLPVGGCAQQPSRAGPHILDDLSIGSGLEMSHLIAIEYVEFPFLAAGCEQVGARDKQHSGGAKVAVVLIERREVPRDKPIQYFTRLAEFQNSVAVVVAANRRADRTVAYSEIDVARGIG